MITEEEVLELCFGPVLHCEEGRLPARNIDRQTDVTCLYSAALPELSVAHAPPAGDWLVSPEPEPILLGSWQDLKRVQVNIR